MSIMNVILLSSTPIAGLGALLAMGRFEKWALDEHRSERAAAHAAGESLDIAASAAVAPDLEPLPAQPLQAA